MACLRINRQDVDLWPPSLQSHTSSCLLFGCSCRWLVDAFQANRKGRGRSVEHTSSYQLLLQIVVSLRPSHPIGS